MELFVENIFKKSLREIYSTENKVKISHVRGREKFRCERFILFHLLAPFNSKRILTPQSR